MKLRLFTLGLFLCISALAAPNESAKCGHSSVCKTATSATRATPAVPATAATPVNSEHSTTLLSRLLYI